MSILMLAILLQGSYPTGKQTQGSPPTAAGAPTPGNAPATAGAAKGKKLASNDPMRMVCKYDTPVGTRLPGPKICHTAQQWDDERAEARTRTEAAQAAKDIGRQ